jgi:chromosome segregation ATPase
MQLKEKENVQEVSKIMESLKEANGKIEELNKVIGRHESKEELVGKGKEDKDKQILELKEQVRDLIASVQAIKGQAEKENQEKINALQDQVSEYKKSIEILKVNHEGEIKEMKSKHIREIDSLKMDKSDTNESAKQLASLKIVLKEREELLNSTKQSYQSLVEAKSDTIATLNNDMIKLKLSKSEVEKDLLKLQEENRCLVERFKEEIQSVLSLKSALSDEETLASREEFNENIKIINDFFDNPYSRSLKKVFKLKRVRKEDKSVDSMNLMVKNHDFDSRSHEEPRHVSNLEKVQEKNVNEGRVEDMAKPGPRPQPLKARGAPNAMRGRGAPMPRGRGGPGIPMPPRQEPRGNMVNTQSSGSAGTSQNIHIMDPNSKYFKADLL